MSDDKELIETLYQWYCIECGHEWLGDKESVCPRCESEEYD